MKQTKKRNNTRNLSFRQEALSIRSSDADLASAGSDRKAVSCSVNNILFHLFFFLGGGGGGRALPFVKVRQWNIPTGI